MSLKSIGSSPLVCTAIAAVMVSGCGKGDLPKPPGPKVPAVAPASVPSIQTSKPAAAPSTNSERPVEASKSKQKPLPPGTDPNSVFDIAAINQPYIVGPASVNPEDQFQVEAGKPGVDSTRLVVVAAPKASTGTPRAGFSFPAGFAPVAGTGYSNSGLPLQIRCDKTDSILALVPAGAALIGNGEGPPECQPEFSVHLDSFYMEVFEVTVAEFEKYRSEMRDKKKPIPPTSNSSASPRMPVLGVQWGAANTFARWAGMDLPTEAELEKSARGPNNLRTPWGDGRAVFASNRTSSTLSMVGTFSTDVSPYGIYDLAGNAREWCSDLYSEQGHRDALGSNNAAPNNWAGPKKVSNGNLHVVKGNGPDWSAWHRQGRDIGKGFPDVGFRCVLRIPNADSKAGT